MIALALRDRDTLRQCGARLSRVLTEILEGVGPGVSTAALNAVGERAIRAAGGAPVFKGYRTRKSDPPYPASICVSVNDEVVHGIPRPDRWLAPGDLVGIDLGMRYPASGGLVTDMAVTVAVGKPDPVAARLLARTRQALERGIAMLRPGIRMGDLGSAIQQVIEAAGFSVIQELVGHGVGRELHEEPHVPNYGRSGTGPVITEGMVLAIEPMAAAGGPMVRLADDGWTWRTADGSLAAHFEHTVLVTATGAEVLTRQ